MVALRAFRQEIKVRTAGLEPAAITALLVKTAKEALAGVIADGSASPSYTRIVNGQVGAAEESVQLPGPILYVFDYLDEVVSYALTFLEGRSPVLSGRYSKSHFAYVGGQRVAPSEIPAGAEVIITNRQPYSRKIEVGHMKMRVPPGVYEAGRQAVQAKYRQLVDVQVKFLTLENGYVLRRGTGRKGSQRGDPIAYPSLVINMKS